MPIGPHDLSFSKYWQTPGYTQGSPILVDKRWVIQQFHEPFKRDRHILEVFDMEAEKKVEQPFVLEGKSGYLSVTALANGKVAVLSGMYKTNSRLQGLIRRATRALTEEEKLDCKKNEYNRNAGSVHIFDIQQNKVTHQLAIGNNVEVVYSLPENRLVSVNDIYDLESNEFEKVGQTVKLWDISQLDQPVCVHSVNIGFRLDSTANFQWHKNKLYMFDRKHLAVFDPEKPADQAISLVNANADQEFHDRHLLKNGQIIVALIGGVLEFYNEALEKTRTIVNPDAYKRSRPELHIIADEKYFLYSDALPETSAERGKIQVWDVEKAELVEETRLKNAFEMHEEKYVEVRPLAEMEILQGTKTFVYSPSADGRMDCPQFGIVDLSPLKTLQLQKNQGLSASTFAMFSSKNEVKENTKESTQQPSFCAP